MTSHRENVYDRYRQADFTDRLFIYLQFPELRDDFLDIDQNEGKTDFFKTAVPPTKRFNPVGKWIDRCFSFLL